MGFLPDGTAVVTERTPGACCGPPRRGARARYDRGARPNGEAGLLGVAVSPDFETDRTLFLYLTTDTDNRVVGPSSTAVGSDARESSSTASRPASSTTAGASPSAPTATSTSRPARPATPTWPRTASSLAGKILRITPDGDPAPGNPDPDSPVWSLGHRNVQGLAWDDEGRLWASEFGDWKWDELNLVEKGGNYGWPEVEGAGGERRTSNPQVVWPVDQASPSGLAFADGHLWMAGLRGQRLWRVAVDGEGVEAAGVLRRGVRPAAHRGRRTRRAALADDLQPRRARRARRTTTGSSASALTRAAATPGRQPGRTTARRAARRSVVRIAGPSTAIAMPVVIARPVSQPPVEVSSV